MREEMKIKDEKKFEGRGLAVAGGGWWWLALAAKRWAAGDGCQKAAAADWAAGKRLAIVW